MKLAKVAVVGAVLALAACSNPPHQGTVIDKKYSPFHYSDWTSWTNGACDHYTTTTTRNKYGSSTTTTCDHYQQIPVYHHDPVAAKWQLELQADDGDTKHDKTGWITVSEHTYDQYNNGDHYPH